MMTNNELYFSVDVETDGPTPGLNSMLQLGCVVFTHEGEEVGAAQFNFKLFPGAKPDPKTMAWWGKHPDKYEQTRRDQLEPREAMDFFKRYVHTAARDYEARQVMLAYPAGFDFTWTHFYFGLYAAPDPFGFSCLDLKSYASAAMGYPFRRTVKATMPRMWFEGIEDHTHVAVEDAREQGQMFFRIRDTVARLHEAAGPSVFLPRKEESSARDDNREAPEATH